MSEPGGGWPAGEGMKISRSTRTWTHPVAASTGYDGFCRAPSLGSKPHCLSGSPAVGGSGEAGGVTENSWPTDGTADA